MFLAVDQLGALYISDMQNSRIQKWLPNEKYGTTVAGQPNGASGHDSSSLSNPGDIIVEPNGDIYVADAGNHRVMYWQKGSSVGKRVAGTGRKLYWDLTALFLSFSLWILDFCFTQNSMKSRWLNDQSL